MAFMNEEKAGKSDRIRVVHKTDAYSEYYQNGDEFIVQGTWYGGVQVATACGVPVALSEEEYQIVERARTAGDSVTDSDPSPVCHTDSIPEALMWKDDAGLVTKLLSDAAGGEKLCVRMDVVPPGAYSAKYHGHSVQEEFFMILEGSGTLRLDNREYPVEKGSFIAKPAGLSHAHTFYNSGLQPLSILDIATVQPEDTCYYPDEDVYLHKSGELRSVFRGDQRLTEWSSDPNEPQQD